MVTRAECEAARVELLSSIDYTEEELFRLAGRVPLTIHETAVLQELDALNIKEDLIK